MTDQQRKIYQSEGDRYEALIGREDYQGNIPRAIDEILHVDGLDILDLGAGTGRLTLLLAPRAKSIRAFDASAEMLRVCQERLLQSGLTNWQVDVADHRQLPAPDHSADLAVSGWSVSYLAVWNPQDGKLLYGEAIPMGSYFGLLETVQGWLSAQGLSETASRTYLAGLFASLGVAAENSPNNFATLRDEYSTKGGLNEQMFRVFAEKGGTAALTTALAEVLARVRG